MKSPHKAPKRYEYANWNQNSKQIASAKKKNTFTMETDLSAIYSRLLSNPKFLKYVEYLKSRYIKHGYSKAYDEIAQTMQAGQTGDYGKNVMTKTSHFLQKYFKNYKH